jgi:hypothetical protein
MPGHCFKYLNGSGVSENPLLQSDCTWPLPGHISNHISLYFGLGSSGPADVGWSINHGGLSGVGRRRLSINLRRCSPSAGGIKHLSKYCTSCARIHRHISSTRRSGLRRAKLYRRIPHPTGRVPNCASYRRDRPRHFRMLGNQFHQYSPTSPLQHLCQ